MVYEGQFTDFKSGALKIRKEIKSKGHCSCIVKLSTQGWFIQDCPTKLCVSKKDTKK